MESLPLFLAASIALIVTPGPDILYVLSRGIAEGKWAGVMSAWGVTCGIFVHTLAASLGLAVLLSTSRTAFVGIKLAGGLYLIYLGWQMIVSRKGIDLNGAAQKVGLKMCCVQGFVTNVLNPKVALFFVAFLPQFVRPDAPSHALAMIGLGLMFALMTVVFLTILGLAAGSIGLWLQARHKAASILPLASGGLIMALGLSLLFPCASRP